MAPWLTDGERGRVQGLREAGKSVRAIHGRSSALETSLTARCYRVVLPAQDVSLSSRRGSPDGCFAWRLRKLLGTAAQGRMQLHLRGANDPAPVGSRRLTRVLNAGVHDRFDHDAQEGSAWAKECLNICCLSRINTTVLILCINKTTRRFTRLNTGGFRRAERRASWLACSLARPQFDREPLGLPRTQGLP
ncbi:hypothetical protein JG688_00017094 [Phytophthora aleatoria]|uniref:Uncharacterized protein n=1 Tax=Phytophthora aleatoria TaxID=2496075 RepID=A0A8J5IR44_9STRA|nr:hypothetical protein JG688_00017094 [Phytophthora aleatoria]